jgi:hypothetical protein
MVNTLLLLSTIPDIREAVTDLRDHPRCLCFCCPTVAKDWK